MKQKVKDSDPIFVSEPGKNCDSVEYSLERTVFMQRQVKDYEENIHSTSFRDMTPPDHFQVNVQLDILDIMILVEALEKYSPREKFKDIPKIDVDSISAKDIRTKDFYKRKNKQFMVDHLKLQIGHYFKKMIDGIPSQNIMVYVNSTILGTLKRRSEISELLEEAGEEG